jgi:hypothetical protein
MSFLHIYLVQICHSSTYTYLGRICHSSTSTWSGYVTRYMWRNHISRPDGCGKMTDPDQMDVEE